MATYSSIKKSLLSNPHTWLITGVAGFIGSNLLETLLELNQKVVGLDNFSTGSDLNLQEVQSLVSKKQWSRFTFIKGDISNLKSCELACQNIDYVLHQAAIGSVPRSIKDPIKTIDANLKILCTILEKNKFKSFLFISSTRLYFENKKTDEDTNIIVNPNNSTYLFNLLKLTSENLCLSKKNKNIKVVRLSNLYGENFDKQIYLLPTLLRDSKKKRKIKISINKKSKKNYLNVKDAIPLILKIINKSKHRLYNIASDKLYTLDFIAKNIKKKTKCKIKYENQKIKHNEPRINIERVKREFNFSPKNDFKNFLLK